MPHSRKEIVLRGLGVSHGIAIGEAFLVEIEHPRAPEVGISASDIPGEKKRFENAVAKAENEILALKEKGGLLPETAREEASILLDAHLAMLSGSRLVRGVLNRIETEAAGAETAVEREVAELVAQFRGLKDRYIAAKSDDIEAVGNRLLRILMDLPYIPLGSVPPGGVVLAASISPADAVFLDPRRYAGIATIHGGAAGHTAIIARSLGLPAVLGVERGMLENAAPGCMAIVDGIEGIVILNPAPSTLKDYEARQAVLQEDRRRLEKNARLPAVTTDGVRVALRANLEVAREAEAIRSSGAEGIGLFRTEFMFMNRQVLPDEEEQFETAASVIRCMEGQSVTFRTLDIGGDKIAKALGGSLAPSANPALGLRAIRLSLREPGLLKTQFRAMIRAAALGPVRILLPMVTTADEVVQARRILKACFRELQNEGARIPEAPPPLGTMIEIPAAALSADSLAAVSDFFSLGTNDLVQYTVAIDRGDDQVASLYNPLNPAVLRLMEFSIQAGLRAGITVGICGEMGADPKYTPLLLGLGIRDFSVGHAGLPRIKDRLRALSLRECEEHARTVMDQYDPAVIARLVDEFSAQ